MGDSRRFDIFADLIARNIHKRARIADVASGGGALQAALRLRGYTDVTSWDKRRRNASGREGYRYGLFEVATAPADYDAVVAMHPDGGTDHAVMYAVQYRVPAIVCPCCVIPSAAPYSGARDYKQWCRHLEGLAVRGGCSVQWAGLPITGRSDAMIIRPTKAAL